MSCFQPVFIHCPFLSPVLVPTLPTSLVLTPGYVQIALYFFYLLHQARPRGCFCLLSLHSSLTIPVFHIYLPQPELLPQCAEAVAVSSPNELSEELWAVARTFPDPCWKHLTCQSSGTGCPLCRSSAVDPLSQPWLLCSSSRQPGSPPR